MSGFTDNPFWQQYNTLAERNAHMLDNQVLTDVTFKVSATPKDEPVVIKAHKYMLVSASPVFWSMFCGELQEYGDIIVCNIEPDAFKAMLRFIYTEDTILNGNNVMYVLNAAKKYQLQSLVEACSKFLKNELDSSNVCSVLDHSLFFNEDSLTEKCFEIIERNPQWAFNSYAFLEISRNTLIKLLEMENIKMDELHIFERAFKWASNNKKYDQSEREALGEALFKIRFPIMSAKEFTRWVCDHSVLTSEEELVTLKYIASYGVTAKPKMFPCHKRKTPKPEPGTICVGSRIKFLNNCPHILNVLGVAEGEIGIVTREEPGIIQLKYEAEEREFYAPAILKYIALVED